MGNKEGKVIYTIGHSTHDIEVFLEMLSSFHIDIVVDVRRFPGSRKYPQYNVEPLRAALQSKHIQYAHLEELGGRRKVAPDSKNTRWRNASFQGYADYMETESFHEGIAELVELAANKKVAYMCSEAVWWRCHRSMISDYLKAQGWTVMHIMGVGKAEEHKFTSPAIVENCRVSYSDN